MNRIASRLLIAASALGAGAAVLFGPAPAAVAGGLLLAFALPGSALTDLVMRRAVTATERIVLAPAFNLALVVVGGLALFAAGVDLDRTAWVALTVVTTMVALIAAAVRDRSTPEQVEAPTVEVPAEAAAPAVGVAAVVADVPAQAAPATATSGTAAGGGTKTRTGIVRPGVSIAVVDKDDDAGEPAEPPVTTTGRWLLRALPLLLAAAMLGGAAWLSLDSAHQADNRTVTALSATAAGPVGAGELRPVKVTVSGLVERNAPYQVVVTGSNGSRLQVRNLDVTSGTWSATLLLPARDRVAINLFRSGDAAPYRTTLLSRAI